MKQSKFIICRMKQKIQQTKRLFFSTWLNDDFMFSYEFFKAISLYSYKSFKKLKSLKINHEIFVNFHNSFQKLKTFNKNSLKNLLTNHSIFFLFEHRTFIHKFKSSKIIVKTFLNRVKFSLLKRLTKFKRWIILKSSNSKRQKRQLKSTIST